MQLQGSEIKRIRESKGISVEDLAREVGIPDACLEEVEKGKRRLGNQTLKKLTEALNIDEEQFSAFDQGSGEKIEKETGEYISYSAGRKLRQVREEQGLTLVECGKKAGISYTHISEIERGNVCPSLKTLDKLATALGKPVSFFLKSESPITLGERVRKLREAQGLTQVKLAAQVGISDSLIAQVETGKAQPSLNTLEKLAETLGVSVDYFLTEPKENNPETNIIVPIKEWAEQKRGFGQVVSIGEKENWQQELAVNIVHLIEQYSFKDFKISSNPVTNEIISLVQCLPIEKQQSILDYIQFVAGTEGLQNSR